jgi:hypothetical protein
MMLEPGFAITFSITSPNAMNWQTYDLPSLVNRLQAIKNVGDRPTYWAYQL